MIIQTSLLLLTAFSGGGFRRFLKRIRNSGSRLESNRTSADYVNDAQQTGKQLADYRQQYINDEDRGQTTIPRHPPDGRYAPTPGHSYAPSSLSDFEGNYINTTRTSVFSPSIISLPNDDIQFTRNYSSQSTNTMHTDSILMRAYSVQESRRSCCPT